MSLFPRFGPLVWRTSKERKKTKIHRRDKCNSGDSGIQVELDNDDVITITNSNNFVPESMEVSPPYPSRVVRSGSAKSSKSTNPSPIPSRAPIKVINKKENDDDEVTTTTTLSMRSLSQPTGLDRLSHHRHHEQDDDVDATSDTDSISSQQDTTAKETAREDQPVYAEVLYNFKPGGPEELALQKGDLVEVIKKDTGPWWWGQIKLDAVIAASGHVQAPYGWFPKDFVRILPTFAKPRTPRKQSKKHHHHHHRRSRSQDPQAHHHIDDSEDSEPEDLTNCNPIVHVNVEQDVVVEVETDIEARTSQPTSEMMHQNAIKELINAETVYVNLLESLCIG